MSKTYLMGEGKLSEEEKQIMEIVSAEQQLRQKELSEREIEKENQKRKVTLADLLNTNVDPLEDRVIVWPDEAPVMINGIIVPDEAKKAIQQEQSRGTIIKVGPGKNNGIDITSTLLLNLIEYSSDVPTDVLTGLKSLVERGLKINLAPGERVLYGRYAGTPAKDEATGTILLIMRPGDIFVKL